MRSNVLHASRSALFAAIVALGLASGGCAGPLRFRDEPVVWAVDDRASIPEPAEREYLKLPYFADVFFLRRSERGMAFGDLEPAWDVNAMEEVPDSSWFTNRIGLRDLTPAELARGPADLPPPQPPFEVTKGKTGGGNLGFVAKDATGRSFLVKVDRPPNDEMQTGTSVVGNRLVWAFGFDVPSDYVMYLRRDQLRISPEATTKDDFDEKIPYTTAMLEATLASGMKPQGGLYRVSASELLKGKPKGGWPAEGVRADDPNDRVPHQHRRSLRGLRVLAAWINHSDMKDDNTLDMFVERDGRSYLKHYLIDFGEVFGGHGAEKRRREDGFEHYFDWSQQGQALLAFGLWVRPWETVEASPFRAVGTFSAVGFDPERWREAYPYWPFDEMDPTDAFWGAKIVMRYRREHLVAAVDEGRFSEPGAATYLVDTLERRRDAIGRVWLEGLTALDAFAIQPGFICATDLGVQHGVATRGVVERLDDDGSVAERAAVSRDGRVCVAAPVADEYAVVRLRIRRGDVEKPALEVHVRGGASPRILGIVRDARR
jgi:hypothetical protein